MTSMSSTLRNYTDLEEVSATLDKLKENALKKIRSINDVRDCNYKKKFKKINEYEFDYDIYNNYVINQKEVLSKENDFLNDHNHQNVDSYDLFKNDASNKSKNLNDDFEYDFANMDGCLYNECQQLNEGPYAYTKQYEGSCSDRLENLQEGNIADDEDHYLSSVQQEHSMSKRFYEYDDYKDEDASNLLEGKAHDMKYESSPYTYNPMKNTRSIENYSNDNSHKESCNSELDGEPMEDDNISMKNSYNHMHIEINDFDIDNKNDDLIKRDKMKGSSLDNDFFSTYEAPNVDENNSVGKNYEISSNLDIQEVNESLNESALHLLRDDNCKQRHKKTILDENVNKLHYQVGTNSKVDEQNRRLHSDHERKKFKDVNMNTQTFNKFGNKFVRRRFEDFKDRRRINDRGMPFHMREFEPQGFKKSFNHTRSLHQKMFLRRPNFNERRYNMSHIRNGNGLHNFRNPRLKDHFSHRPKPFYRYNSKEDYKKTKEDYKNTSQQSSPSLHKERTNSNHSCKRLRRSLSPLSNENNTLSHKDNHLTDTKRSPSPDLLNNRHHRFKSSGLGGYSPRRRRPEIIKKTPSPLQRSPDRKKTRAWDVAPPGIDSKVVAAIVAARTAQQAVSKQVSTLSSISPLVPMNVINPTNNLNVTSNTTLSSMLPSILQYSQVNQPLSTVTLTHATRSIRRLYVGNVPSTVSDGELMEFMNAAMLSANANHIPRTKPCINCMVNIEKAYAFAEFITPEDATTALGFDGVTLHGTILKIRRPKDFIAPEHGGCPIAQPMINLVANVVLDSPQKIFIGGISSILTPDKVKEIVTAFGQLKSFHWKAMNQKDCCMAFLEYLDPEVTQQACIGLNGMHLGGQVLTVLQATPDAKYEIFSNNAPFYDIPKDALPLLEAPTNILKLYNLISEEEVSNMQDEEVKELMEDVRFECRKFGNIRSMQLVKPPTIRPKSISIVCNNTEGEKGVHPMECDGDSSNIENEENASTLETINEAYNIDHNASTIETIKEAYNNDENASTLETIKEAYNNDENASTFETIKEAYNNDENASILKTINEEYTNDENASILKTINEEYTNDENAFTLETINEAYSNDENEENVSTPEITKQSYINDESKGNDSTLETIKDMYGNHENKDSDSIFDITSKIYNIGEKKIPPTESENFQNIEGSYNVEDYKQEQVKNITVISPKVDCEHDCKKELVEESIQPIPILNSSIPNMNNICGIDLPKSLELEPLKVGHIYIEYSRIESACQAAHALRGRQFGQLKVDVMYVSPRLYLKYFGKGPCTQTHQEKQLLSLAVQKHLTSHIKDNP